MADYVLNALFVTESWVKSNTDIGAQLDIRKLVPSFQTAQDMWIQPVLGTRLYQRLMQGIVSNDLNSNEEALLENIRPALAYYIVYRSIVPVAIEMGNSGISRFSNDTSSPADIPQINLLRHEAKSAADFYASLLNDYLCTNKALFPEYGTETAPMHPNKPKFSTGTYYSYNSCGCEGACECGCDH